MDCRNDMTRAAGDVLVPGQGHSLTFVLGHSNFINFIQVTIFALKPLDRLKSNYILSLHETSGPKFIETI